MASMVIHDRRLKGVTPAYYNYVMQVNQHVSTNHICQVVARRARERGKLKRLHILCHGYESHDIEDLQQCVVDARGGFGLQLGKDNLDLNNYGLTAAWKNLVEEIVIFACATADSPNQGKDGDGRRLCGYIALLTNAKVIAARDTQYYFHASDAKPIDFGDWEGPVYEFNQTTPMGSTIANPNRYKVQRSLADAA